MPNPATPEANFAEARAIARAIAQSLPSEVAARTMTLKSKLPFKAMSIRETLIHRVSALATPAIALFEAEHELAGSILTRAVLESVAVAFALDRESESFLTLKDEERFDGFLMSCLVGSRWPGEEVQARNILTLIDHVDKTFEGYRATYDALCEYAHPNWSGVMGAFGTLDRKNYVLKLGRSERSTVGHAGVTALAMALSLFHHQYNELAVTIVRLNEHFVQSPSRA